jgi:WD40 repeat protein
MDSLEQAVALGYDDASVTAWAPELAPLRALEPYGGLLNRMRAAASDREPTTFEPTFRWNTIQGPASLSADGSRLLANGALFDADTGALLGWLLESEHGGYRPSFTGDGRFVVTLGDREQGLGLWDAFTAEFLGELETGPALHATIASRGSDVLVGRIIWDVAQGKPRILLATPHAEYGWLSRDGRCALTADVRAATLCSTETGRVIRTYEGPESTDSDRWEATFSPDGRRAALLDHRTGVCRVIETASGDVVREISDAECQLADFALISGPAPLITADSQGRLRWWDLEREDPVHEIEGLGTYGSFEVDSRDRYLLESHENSLRVLDAATGAERWRKDYGRGRGGSLDHASFAPDGERVIVGLDARCELFDAGSGSLRNTLRGGPLRTGEAALAPDGEHLAVPVEDGTLRIVELETGETSHILRGHGAEVLRAVYAPPGNRLASLDDGGTIVVWDADARREIGRLDQPPLGDWPDPLDALGMEFDPAGERLLVWGSAPRRAPHRGRVAWAAVHAADGEILTSFPVGADPNAAAWSSDGARIALVTQDGRLVLADPVTGAELPLELPRSVAASAVAFHPEQPLLAVGGATGQVLVMNLATGDLLHERTIEPDPFNEPRYVGVLRFSSDGSRLLSTAIDWGPVACWDTLTGDLEWKHELDGQWGKTIRADFSPDGSRVAYCSLYESRVVEATNGEVIREWDLTEGHWQPRINLGTTVATAQFWGEWTCLDADSMASRYTRVELAGGQSALSIPTQHGTGPAQGLKDLLVFNDPLVFTGEQPYPFDCFAGRLLDPIKVRAAIAGIDVTPARWNRPPTLDLLAPLRPHVIVAGEEIPVEVIAGDPAGVAGFEVLRDGVPVPAERLSRTGDRLAFTVRVDSGRTMKLGIRALGRNGLISRSLEVVLRTPR